jgi:hypothetical protein
LVGILIEYNRRTGEKKVQEFTGESGHLEAMRERFKLEANEQNPDVEIVAIGADSLESVKRSHSRYFLAK